MKLVFIYGPPAVGKLTIAREIAALADCKVFHNHLSIDCIEPVFEFGTKSFWRLVELIRLETVEEAARADVNLVYTFCYAKGSDDLHVQKIINVVERNGGEVCFVLLTCKRSALEQRVVEASRRKFGKVDNLALLAQLLDKYELFSPVPQRPSLQIDNTDLSPQMVAQKIVSHYRLR